jgi:HK97 family phage portal protein
MEESIRPSDMPEEEVEYLELSDLPRTKDEVADTLLDGLSGNYDSEVKAQIDAVSLKNLLYDEPWVYIICNLVARKISRQWMGVYRGKRREARSTSIPDAKNLMNDVLESPNEWEGYAEFMYRIALELTLMGNAVIWKQRFSNTLMLLPTEYITMDFDDKTLKLKGYYVDVVDVGSSQTNKLYIKAEDVIHAKIPNPNSVYWGLSVWIPGRRSVLFDRYSQEYLLNFYLKQANPGPVIEMSDQANEKQAMRFLKSMELRWTGRASQRRTMILPKGVSAKNMVTTFAEQQLKEHLKDNRDTIRALLSIPPHELGIQSTGSIGSEETEKQLKNFYTSTIIPYQWLIADSFTRSTKDQLGSNRFFKFNNEDVAVLREDEGKKAATANLMLQTMTLNEVRARMWELEPVEGGDVILGMQIADTEVVNSAPPENNGLELSYDSKELEPSDRLKKYLEQNWEWWAKRKAAGEEGELRGVEKRHLEEVLSIFERMAVITLRVFRKQFKGMAEDVALLRAPKPVPGKRGRRKESDIEVFRRRLEKAFAEENFPQGYEDRALPIIESAGVLGYDLALNLPFGLPNEDEIEALRQENSEKRAAILRARALENFEGFTATETDTILGVVRSGTQAGRSLGQIANDLTDHFTDLAPKKAQTIARTEVLTASSMGQAAAMEDAATVIPGLQKVWVTSGDADVRDHHSSLDGKIIPYDKQWKNSHGSLRFPRDPLATAKNRINCFIGDTSFEGLDPRKVFRRMYSGPVVTVNFKSGHKLTGTPNHPVLTSKGWVEMGSLNKGSSVFKAEKFESSGLANIEHIKAKAHKVFSTSSESGVSISKPGLAMDFHGDGSAKDVDIVFIDSGLRDTGNSEFLKKIDKEGFIPSGPTKSLAESCRSSSSFGFRNFPSPTGQMSGSVLPSSLGNTHLAPLDEFGFGATTLFDASLMEAFKDDSSSIPSKLRDLLDGEHLFKVHFDEVVDIVFANFVGHVYNLETGSGIYLANNVVAHNCRCSFFMIPPGEGLEDEVAAVTGRNAE